MPFTVARPCRNLTGFAETPRIQFFREARLRRHVLLCEPRVVREVRREDPLKCHDVSAEAARMKVLALTVPVVAPEGDGVRAVFTAERDLEAPEADAFGFFGVALRLLDLGDEARVHDLLHTPYSIRLAGRAEFRPASYPSKLRENAADFRLGPHDNPVHDRWILRGRVLRPDHSVHPPVLATPRGRAERRPVLGRCDHLFFEHRRSAVPAVLG